MKLKKTIVSVLISLITWLALESVGNASMDPKAQLEVTIKEMFNARGQGILSNQLNIDRFYLKGSELYLHEKSRPKKIKELEQRWDTKIINFKPTATLINLDMVANNAAKAIVYEWTFFDWLDKNGKVVTSGFGVFHEMAWEYSNEKWQLLADSYDEGPLTGVTSPDYYASQKNNSKSTINKPRLTKSEKLLDIKPATTYTYNRINATSYADNWVWDYANGGYYPQYYNNAYYKNYADLGGDCCNYVSQSMRAGNAPFVNFNNNWSNAWWYNNNGTYPNQTSDDTASGTWYYVPSHRNFVKNIKGWGSSTTPSGLRKGDIVYYDWTSNGSWDHVTIVVLGYEDGYSRPLVNSHTNDYYHVPYNYGGSGCSYDLVHLSDTLSD